MVRRHLARYLGLDEARVRVQAPDVGGGFGPKAAFYPEEIVVPLAAMRLASPVKWIEDRREHFVATTQQRDQRWRLDVACTDEGRILGLRGHAFIDNGAYVPYGNLVAGTALALLPGPYVVPAFDVTIDSIFTNTTPVTPVRGAGRPNACFAMERVIDRIARELRLDPAEVRRCNFVRPDQFPYHQGLKARDGSPITYDSGDYEACLAKAEELAGAAQFRTRQAAARAAGRYLGLGISCCVEDTGVGPFEGATVRVQPSGKVVVVTGAAGQGQGHATVLAQICADALGVRPEDVVVQGADTGAFPLGIGTIGSRVATTAGTSVHLAAHEVRKKAIKVAAEQLETAEADLVLEGGTVHVVGVSQLRVSLASIAARLAGAAGVSLPEGVGPGLEATAYFNATKTPYACSANIAEVEVDIETGAVTLLNYCVAHDCGRLINPMTVDGQIIGGAVHGIGNALFEHMIYDDAGQPLTTNYGEYLLPLATELPRIRIAHLETPSPLNPLGIKGAGEGGTIPAMAAVIAAVEDALAPLGVTIEAYPIEPERLLDQIDAARRSCRR
jgi:carbon-monoxide dehydrogenase large subunit